MQKSSFLFSLIKSGANMEILNSRQWRPLDAAAAHGWEKIVSALLESGTNIEPRGKIKVKPSYKIQCLVA